MFGSDSRCAQLIVLLALCQACASSSNLHVALVPRLPQDVLALARTRLKAQGYTIAERAAPMLPDSSRARAALGGDLRAQLMLGPDLDTRGILYEVIEVTATPVPETGQTRVTVRGGMESNTGPGMWVRVPSTRKVRTLAQQLLIELSGSSKHDKS